MALTARDHFKSEIDRKLGQAATIADTAEKEGRGLTDDERKTSEELLRDVSGLKASIEDIDSNEALKKAINDARGPVVESHEDASDTSSVGNAFVKSNGYTTIRESKGIGKGTWSTGAVELPMFGSKTTVTETASPVAFTDNRAGIDPIRLQRLTVADLIPQGSTTSNAVVTIQELANTNAAAAVAEGAAKPESAITFQTVNEPVVKIATFLPVSDEMLEDVDQIRSYLDARLSLFVRIKEEQQLLSGTGTAPELSGIMDRAIASGSALSLDTDRSTDAIFQAMTAIRTTSFLDPDAMVIHPTDWASIRLLKDTNGQYYGGGPFTGAYGNGGIAQDSLWGLKVVVTTAMTQGTALVGAFAQGAFIWRRSGLTVEASNSHQDFFQKNLTAVRAEERLALGVLRPAAFYKITGIDALMGS